MYVTSFHKYELHAVSVADDEVLLLMVKFNVATESQPAVFVPLNVYTPDAVYVASFHKNELHAVSVADDEVLLLIVKFNVATESHPTAFVPLNV